VSEVNRNVHVVDSLEVECLPWKRWSDLIVRARFMRNGRPAYVGSQLYAWTVLVSPSGYSFRIEMCDDGVRPDDEANDGWYSGRLDMERAFRDLSSAGLAFDGKWAVCVYAQTVNLARDDDPPEVQASAVGGYPVASPIAVALDPSLPCPFAEHASVQVS
jgi:hypothetical protein